MEEAKKAMKNKVLHTIISSIIGVCIAVFFALSCFQFYLCVYLKPFWVDGQSMYPYLNEHAKNADGSEMGHEVGAKEGSYNIDYGVMNCHKKVIDKLERFDVIITRYNEQDISYIKRIIGLPGEKIQFIDAGAGKEHNGDLYVNGVYIVQPIDIDVIRAGDYTSKIYELKENEYFVAGDNRYPGGSKDCRDTHTSTGIDPIKKEYIIGKAVALTGKCSISYNVNEAKYEPFKINYHWPRFLK